MAEPGDIVPLGQMLVNQTWFGYATDIDSPTGVRATMEQWGDEAIVTMDVLIGPRGYKGDDGTIVKIKWDTDIEEIGDLPLDGDAAGFDINDGVWIGDLVYIWAGEGHGWIPKRPGPAGPRGSTPHFDWSIETLTWEDQQLGVEPTIESVGTDLNPQLHITAPQGRPGPIGPAGFLRSSADYQEPEDGPQNLDVVTWNNTAGKYEPQSVNLRVPRFFSIPEGAFTNFSGVAQRQQIMAFPVPPLPFAWVPLVIGHIRATGLELDIDPLIIGSEVRLGNPTAGPLVGRGFGNSSSWSNITPHFSTASSPMDAVSPDGSVAVVPANHSGNAGTLYMNLYNDGLFGIYNFDKTGAQLVVVCIPV